MHYWGDDWFKKHGKEFYNAIGALEYRIRKWAFCGVYGKEKYGTYRDEYFRMWDGGLCQILFGYRVTYQNNWFMKLINHIDMYLIPVKKTKWGWIRRGLTHLNWKIGLTKLVHKWQAKQINKAFQITCKEYPDVVDELIVDVDCYELIKPCKWGDVDGTKIHNKYWKTVNEL